MNDSDYTLFLRRLINIMTSTALSLFLAGSVIVPAAAQCGCNFVISTNPAVWQFDGAAMGVKPGDKICFASGTRVSMYFVNINGTAANPVTITNMCDGKVTIKNAPTASYGIEFHKSSFFRITGSGNPSEPQGLTIDGGNMAINLMEFSTDFEVDHLKILNAGYGGVIAKTDPTCDPHTWRGNFTMTNTSYHDNEISTLGGEGFYIGSSHYYTTVALTCSGVPTNVQEHEVIGVKVYNNNVHDTGRDGIQVGSATTNCTIHDNKVYNFGMTNEYSQQSGIQINPGTNAECFNNIVDTGTGYGVFLGGEGASHLYNNIIMNSLQGGIICQDYPPYNPSGFVICNNTLYNNTDYGIYMFSQNTNQNLFANNVIIATSQPTFLYVRLNNPTAIKWTDVNNIKTPTLSSLKFVNAAAKDFHLLSGSPAIDAGKDVSAYGITFDLDNKPRPKGTKYDIGAYEFQPPGPTSNAGPNQTLTLPTSSLSITGSGTSATGITGYSWTEKSGAPVTLSNTGTPTVTISGLTQGQYVFTLMVTDASGFATSDVTVTVNPATVNQNPVANAGTNKTITLPQDTLTIHGMGTDADGSIASYLWTKVSGPAATLTNATTPNLKLSSLLQGTYIFQLTVTDNLLATGSAQVTVTVNPAGTNQPPVVSAGAAQTIFLPTTQITIAAAASDPDGTIAAILWEKKTGGGATLTNATTLTLTASGLSLGAYTFRITVTDNQGASSFSEVNVNVLNANQSPTANAGLDQSITLPTNAISLTGSGTDTDGSISSYAWVQVNGPSCTLAGANSSTLSITNMVQGTYVFDLTVTDNLGATGTDQVQVAVSIPATGPNQPPLAEAGGNISLYLPTNSTNIYGSGFDPDGAITSYFWIMASGGQATLNNVNSPTLTVGNLVAGQYIFKLIVTDDKGATGEDFTIVTVNAPGTNIFPVASAGLDQIIRLPQASAILNGVGTDADGWIVSYAWTQVAGGTSIISSPTAPVTKVNNFTVGDYIFRLTVTDNQDATDFNDVIVRVVNTAVNLPPIVEAGVDTIVYLPQNSVTLNASASDDGTITSYSWSQLSGPATAALVNPSQLNVLIQGLVQGVYVFQLTVTDNNGASVFDIVQVTVVPSSYKPPTVSAGPDQQITLPTDQTTLTGSVTSSTSTIISTQWSQILGPTATLSNNLSLILQVSNLIVGTYLFKLTVTDNLGKQASAQVQVIVNPVPPNQPPIVSAGPNQSITLPVSQVNLNGAASDPDGNVVSVLWSQTQGPNNATLSNQSALSATVSNLVAGSYIFKLTATDNNNAAASNTTFVSVSNDPATTQKVPPSVYAGGVITLVLPRNDTTVVGVASTQNGFIQQYTWEQESGSPAAYKANHDSLYLINLADGKYTFRLTVTESEDTLSASDVLTVLVIENTQGIPKFFSPNNDGIGDLWVFRNIQEYKDCSLVVFSRSGQIVYEANPYQNTWDGTYNGKPLGDGDYYYTIKCKNGKTLTGAVRIIR